MNMVLTILLIFFVLFLILQILTTLLTFSDWKDYKLYYEKYKNVKIFIIDRDKIYIYNKDLVIYIPSLDIKILRNSVTEYKNPIFMDRISRLNLYTYYWYKKFYKIFTTSIKLSKNENN